MSIEEQNQFSKEFIQQVKESEGTAELQASDNWGNITGQGPSFTEGSFKPYKDTTGNWTIGYGTKLSSEELEKYSAGISVEEAEGLLLQRLTEAGEGASRIVPNFGNLPIGVQEVVTDLVYNMGTTGVSENFPMFIEAIENENYPLAIANLKYVSPSTLNLSGDQGEFSKYFSEYPSRANENIGKLEFAFDESVDTSSDDGVFNVMKMND